MFTFLHTSGTTPGNPLSHYHVIYVFRLNKIVLVGIETIVVLGGGVGSPVP